MGKRGVLKHTEETKRQISKSMKGVNAGSKNAMFGLRGKDHPGYGHGRPRKKTTTAKKTPK